MGKRYAVLVGITEPEDKSITELEYSVRDVKALSKHLQTTLDYETENVYVLTSDAHGPHYASRENILNQLQRIAQVAEAEDTLLFHFSGHGVEHEKLTYLLPVDARIGHTESLLRTAISSSELRLCFAKTKLRSIVFILDCCRSKPIPTARTTEVGDRVTSKMTTSLGRDIAAAMQPEKVQDGSEGIDYSFGVIYSCREGERAYDWPKERHGFFTYYLLKALRVLSRTEQIINTKDLAKFVMTHVDNAVRKAYQLSQRPWDQGEAAEIGSCRWTNENWYEEMKAADSDSSKGDSGHMGSKDSVVTKDIDESVGFSDIKKFIRTPGREVYNIQLIPKIQSLLLEQGHLQEIVVEDNTPNKCYTLFDKDEPVFLLPNKSKGGEDVDTRILLVDPQKQLAIVCVEHDDGYLLALGINRIGVDDLNLSKSAHMINADFIFYEADAQHVYIGTFFPHHLFEVFELQKEKVIKSKKAGDVLENFKLFLETDKRRVLDSTVNLPYEKENVWIQERNTRHTGLTEHYAHFKFDNLPDDLFIDDGDYMCIKQRDIEAPLERCNSRSGYVIGTFRSSDRAKKEVCISLQDGVDIEILRRNNLLATYKGGQLKVFERELDAMIKLQRGRVVNQDLPHFFLDFKEVKTPEITTLKKVEQDMQETPFLDDFDEYQKQAVIKALATPQISLIQGPPGTGKTTVICEIIRRFFLANPNAKVLVSSQSNMAVDNVLGKIGKEPMIRAIRVGRQQAVTTEGKPFLPDNAARSWLTAVCSKAQKNKQTLQSMVAASALIRDLAQVARNVLCCAEQLTALLQQQEDVCKDLADKRGILNKKLEHLRVCEKEKTSLEFLDITDNCSRRTLEESLSTFWRQSWPEFIGKDFFSTCQKENKYIERQLKKLVNMDQERVCLEEDVKHISIAERQVTSLLNSAECGRIRRSISKQLASKSSLKLYYAAGTVGNKHLEQVERCIGRLNQIGLFPPLNWIMKYLTKRSLIRTSVIAGLDKITATEELERTHKEQHTVEDKLRHRVISHSKSINKACSVFMIDGKQLCKSLEESIQAIVSNQENLDRSLEKSEADYRVTISDLAAAIGTTQEHAEFLAENVQYLNEQVVLSLPNLSTDVLIADLSNLATSTVNTGESSWNDSAQYIARKAVDAWDSTLASFVDSLECFEKRTCVSTKRWLECVNTTLAAENIPPEISAQYYDRVNLVAGTCIGLATDPIFQTTDFDLVLTDEAGRATPLELLVPMLRGKKFVLVGDHKQLPPQIDDNTMQEFRDKLKEKGDYLGSKTCPYWKHSFFQDFFENSPDVIKEVLQYQYRMHPSIRTIVGSLFYPEINLNERNIEELRHKREHGLMHRWFVGRAALFVDTQRSNCKSTRATGGFSLMNQFEAKLITDMIVDIAKIRSLSKNTTPLDIGVITFYMAQKRQLIKELNHRKGFLAGLVDVEVDSVDAFQGREKDVIFLSTVVSGPYVSRFVASPNRLNVAMSRAKKLLIVTGNRRTLTQGNGFGKKLYTNLINLFEETQSIEHCVRL